MCLLIPFCFCLGTIYGTQQDEKIDSITMPHHEESANKEELFSLDNLIVFTQKSLEQQKMLREQIKNYQEMQEAYIKSPNNNELLLQIAKTAHRLLQGINDSHLEHLFSSDFLSELKLFGHVAAKQGVPRP